MNDLRFAFRQLLKNPGFTLVTVFTLALGIGANTAVFQLLNAVRLKSLAVTRPQELIEIRIIGGNPGLGISDGANAEMTYPLWEQLQKHRNAVTGLFAWSTSDLPIGSGVETRIARSLWVSGDCFSLLGIPPIRGRLLSADDDRRGAGPGGVVISHAFWQREFGGQDSVIGKSLTLGDRVFEIIGVSPPSFFGLEVGKSFDVALPISTRAFWWDNILDRKDAWWLRVMGRLKPGSTLAQTAEYLGTISTGIIEATVPTGYGPGMVETYRKFRLSAYAAGTGVSQLRSDYQRSLCLLLGITGLVLVIACLNIANLTLARVNARAREVAVRIALGASRARLIRQWVTESLLLAAAGAAAGAGLAQFLSRGIVWFLSTQENPLIIDLQADWRLLAFTGAVAILTCVLFGLAPAIRSSWLTPAAALTGGRGTAGNRERFALQRGLAILQVSISLVLLSGALLLVRSFYNLITFHPGFRQDGIFVTFVNFGRQPPERLSALKRELLERIRSIPQVEAAATTSHVPLSGSSWTMGVRVTSGTEVRKDSSKITWVSPDFFKTMEVPLLSGRDFNERDTATSPKVALVNETFLRRFIGTASPIGATLRTGAEPGYPEATYEVVGVVKDTKYGNLRQEIPPIAYVPASQHPISAAWAALVIRSTESLPGIIAALKLRITALDPSIRMSTSALRTQVRDGLARERLMAWLSGFFGGLAAILVMIGLYGLISYITSMRRNELGIRLALGARTSNILWLILSKGLKLACIGVALGLAGAYALTRFLRGLLFGIDPTDPVTLVAISLLLIAVASLACWLPAMRAARVDPLEALRCE